MRKKCLHILLFTACTVSTLRAFAHPRLAPAASRPSVRASSPPHARPVSKSGAKHGKASVRASAAKPPAKRGRQTAKAEKPARAGRKADRRGKTVTRVDARGERKTHGKHGSESRSSRNEAQLARRTPEPLPERAVAPPPEVHVKHDRKHHLDAPPQANAPQAEGQKATSEDFLTAAPAPEPVPVASLPSVVEVAAPAAVVEPGPAKPMPVVSVLRKATPRPQLLTTEEIVETPVLMNALFDRRGRLIVLPAMKGTHDILVHQNVMADHDGLDRIEDDDDLVRMREARLLVPIPENAGLVTDDRLPENRRFARPWTAQFLTALAKAHYARFHTALQVNSAVRTVEFQQRLMRTNGNAAPAEGETASPHLTGQAVDLAKHGLSRTEIAWMRAYLTPLMEQGKVDVEEEFQQACFHISVYKKYMPVVAPKKLLVARHGGGPLANGAMR